MSNDQPRLEASISELIDGYTFEEICRSYVELFGVSIRIFDRGNRLIAEKTRPLPPCELITGNEKGTRRCTDLRISLKDHRPSGSRIETKTCFCGLAYSMAPLKVQSDVIGKILLGPYRPATLERVPEEVGELIPDGAGAEMLDGIAELPGIDEEAIEQTLQAIVNVLEVVLRSAHKAHMTSEMHIATIRESYRELSEKNRTLEAMQEEQKEFERIKANFLATVSHELRTPLTSIIGYSDMLAEGIAGELSPEQKQFVDTIKHKGDELFKLISSILDFSQLDTGHLSLKLSIVRPAELIEDVLRENKERAERRGVTLTTELSPDLPDVEMDAERISTAMTHLIENAIKFSESGAMVTLSATRMAASSDDVEEDDDAGFALMAAPDLVEFAVTDAGIGIDEKEQSTIFTPFTQIDNTSTREHGGAGLGLAIVKQYAEAHGGKVHVSSEVGEGSTFAIRIPTVNQR